jgi:addiction module RelB/DinJ family antitoxin
MRMSCFRWGCSPRWARWLLLPGLAVAVSALPYAISLMAQRAQAHPGPNSWAFKGLETEGMSEQVRYRIEHHLVREAEKVCDKLALSPSQVVSITFAQLVRQRALPFRPAEFPALEEYGATLAEADAAEERTLKEIARDRRAGMVVRFTGEIP